MSPSNRNTPPTEPVSGVANRVRGAGRPEDAAPGRRDARGPFQRLDGIEILLVEDDPEVLEAIAFALESTGAVVHPVDSARAAWALLQTRTPHVVVSDIAMPDEDGYALLRRIRAHRPVADLPAIALTGFAHREDQARVLAAGFSAHAAKPVDPADLVRLVLQVLAR